MTVPVMINTGPQGGRNVPPEGRLEEVTPGTVVPLLTAGPHRKTSAIPAK